MAFTRSMSGRRCPFIFGGMSHAQNFTAQCSHMVLETPALSSVYDDDDGEEEEEEAAAAEVGNGVLILSTHLEYPAITNGAAHNGFAVMVHVKEPALVPAAAGRASEPRLAAPSRTSASSCCPSVPPCINLCNPTTPNTAIRCWERPAHLRTSCARHGSRQKVGGDCDWQRW